MGSEHVPAGPDDGQLEFGQYVGWVSIVCWRDSPLASFCQSSHRVDYMCWWDWRLFKYSEIL